MRIVFVNMPQDSWEAGAWQALEPDAPKGMGGTEFATMMAAMAAARLGFDVAHVGLVEYASERHGIRWVPFSQAGPSLFEGALAWLACFPHALPVKQWGATRVLLWQHWNDYNYCPPGWQRLVDHHGVATKTHQFHCAKAAGVPEDQFVVSGFGVERAWIAGQPWPERQNLIVYGSSPDRGLHHLLEMYPKIHRLTRAELVITYAVERWFEAAADPQRWDHQLARDVRLLLQALRDGGFPVRLTGHLGHRDFLRLLGTSRVLAYPCDPVSHTESFGLVVAEAFASGCHVVLTNADSFPEQYGHLLQLVDRGTPGWQADFQGRVIEALRTDEAPTAPPIRTWEDHVEDALRQLDVMARKEAKVG